MNVLHRFGMTLLVSALLLQTGRVAAQCACEEGGPSMAQMQAYQQEVMRYQTEVVEKQKEILKQFDEDGNGVLRGPEKSKFAKYMNEVKKGKKPNPFASIRPIGQPAAPVSQ